MFASGYDMAATVPSYGEIFSGVLTGGFNPGSDSDFDFGFGFGFGFGDLAGCGTAAKENEKPSDKDG